MELVRTRDHEVTANFVRRMKELLQGVAVGRTARSPALARRYRLSLSLFTSGQEKKELSTRGRESGDLF